MQNTPESEEGKSDRNLPEIVVNIRDIAGVTRDIAHVTRDIAHVTRDIAHVTREGHVTREIFNTDCGLSVLWCAEQYERLVLVVALT